MITTEDLQRDATERQAYAQNRGAGCCGKCLELTGDGPGCGGACYRPKAHGGPCLCLVDWFGHRCDLSELTACGQLRLAQGGWCEPVTETYAECVLPCGATCLELDGVCSGDCAWSRAPARVSEVQREPEETCQEKT